MTRLKSFFILISIVYFVSLLSAVSASCSEGQIDINTASLEELDSLYGIGPAKAQAIIDARTYDTIDDLVNAKGIGESTLEGIKSQGLACVSLENRGVKDNTEVNNVSNKSQTNVNVNSDNSNVNKNSVIVENSQPEVISLNPSNSSKDIKTVENKEKIGTETYALYGFAAFSAILGFLFWIDNKRGKNSIKKNEFR